MQKIDYKKELKSFYKPSPKAPEIVKVPAFSYLMIEGKDATEGSHDFVKAIEALFGLSYTIKFMFKKQHAFDYVVMPLEGLWWADDMDDFVQGKKENWRWNLMIMQPDRLEANMLAEAKIVLSKKKDNPLIEKIALSVFEEGMAAQIMHIGPFSEEHANIMQMHKLIEIEGGTFDGHHQKHHEIYLSDFRKVAPEKMRTVLRQAFVK